MSSLGASPLMSPPSPKCVKSLEVGNSLLMYYRTIVVFTYNLCSSSAHDQSASCVFLSGRSYCVRTQRMLNQCLESLVQKVQSGVVINFEKTGPDPPYVVEGELLSDAH